MWNFVAVNRRYPNFLGGSPLCLHNKKGELGESEYVLDHASDRVNEWMQRSTRAKRAEQSKQMSKWCNCMRKWMRQRPSTLRVNCINIYPVCNGTIYWRYRHVSCRGKMDVIICERLYALKRTFKNEEKKTKRTALLRCAQIFTPSLTHSSPSSRESKWLDLPASSCSEP